MKILTISNTAWDDRNSFGNTQSNWFGEWTDLELCSIYTREAKPKNICCHHYYKVAVGDIVTNFFSWWRIGHVFDYQDVDVGGGSYALESKALRMNKGWFRNVMCTCVELVYSSRIWLNAKLKDYITDFRPDIVFCFAIAEPFRYNILKYVKKYTKAKVVMWIADDVYGQTRLMGPLKRKKYRKRYRDMFGMADKVYGASELMCKEYSCLFQINITPLYKGCLMVDSGSCINSPMKIVYAGNLLYGRDRTLAVLARTISEINLGESRMELEIYSPTFVSEDVKKSLNIQCCSHLYGVRPYSEIVDIMKNADVVLHVESFEENQKRAVRLSFSTKVMDCIQSGAMVLAIGPSDIASIDFLSKIPGVLVVSNLDGLKSCLKTMLFERDFVKKRAMDTVQYARHHLAVESVRKRLQQEFNELLME